MVSHTSELVESKVRTYYVRRMPEWTYVIKRFDAANDEEAISIINSLYSKELDDIVFTVVEFFLVNDRPCIRWTWQCTLTVKKLNLL